MVCVVFVKLESSFMKILTFLQFLKQITFFFAIFFVVMLEFLNYNLFC